MKIKRFILIFLLLIILFSQIVTAKDTVWKEYLKDFLVNNFPSLFDEATIKKNDESYKKWGKETLYPGDFSSDIICVEGSEFEGYYLHVRPTRYYFYDLDFDDIPEVIIYFGALESDIGWCEIYKWYDTLYEMISKSSKEDFFINPNNKIVSVGTSSTKVIDIINKKIVYGSYIDSFGNDNYKGVNYDEIGTYSTHLFFSFESYEAWLACELFLADLRYIPEYDCSDVLDAIKYGKPLNNPKTRDNYFIYLTILFATYFITAKTKKNLKKV